MFQVIEFENEGNVAIVRHDWLTPRKKEVLWPPYKLTSQYNKALTNGDTPNDTWQLYPVRRLFYSTDDILKARKKLKEAEQESDVFSCDETVKQKRKIRKRIFSSSEDEDDSAEYHVPDKKILKSTQKRDDSFVLPTPPIPESGYSGKDSDSTSQADTVIINPNSTLDYSFTDGHSNENEVLRTICRHLSKIENDIKEIKESQNEILFCIKTNNHNSDQQGLTGIDITLPCGTINDVNNAEEWVKANDENKLKFLQFLSTTGGKKLEHITRRILTKIFTNEVAAFFNWTGKNGKNPLNKMSTIALVKDAIRMNAIHKNASDADVESVVKNWFRFSKDRDGGRESRRINTTNNLNSL